MVGKIKTHYVLVLGFGMLLASLIYEVVEIATKNVPYRDVRIAEAIWSNDGLRLSATFEKLECEFTRLDIIGNYGNFTSILKWEDREGLPVDYDRGKGRQTINVNVLYDDIPDSIEIRTRHICDRGKVTEEKVDKLFAIVAS